MSRIRESTDRRRTNDSLVLTALAQDGARLEYRWVEETPASEAAGRVLVLDPASAKWLVLGDSVILELAQVAGVRVLHTPDGSFVNLHLDMTNADRLMSATNQHLRHRLAITLNGRLLAAPVIGSPFGSSIPVTEDLDSAVAVQLASRLHAVVPGAPIHHR